MTKKEMEALLLAMSAEMDELRVRVLDCQAKMGRAEEDAAGWLAKCREAEASCQKAKNRVLWVRDSVAKDVASRLQRFIKEEMLDAVE